jgi:Flp pilus assembly protein TadG
VSRLGQAVVEFAVVLPLIMVVLLGFGETAFLVATQHAFQNGADVLAERAAFEMSSSPGESWKAGWQAVVADEDERTGCGDTSPSVALPDGTHGPGDRVLVVWHCHYTPHITSGWGGLPVTVQSEAVVPGSIAPPATPTPTPAAT